MFTDTPETLEHSLQQAADSIQRTYPHPSSVVVILGSSGGGFAAAIKAKHPEATVIAYRDIPGFQGGQVVGHTKELLLYPVNGHHVAVMSGRNHFYEGHAMAEVVFPIRVLKHLGADTPDLSPMLPGGFIPLRMNWLWAI